MCKKILSLFLTVAMLVLITGVATVYATGEGVLPLYDNFESYEENEYPSTFTPKYTGTGASNQKIVTAKSHDGLDDNKVFRLEAQYNWASEHYVTLPDPLPSNLSIEAYVKPVQGSWPGEIGLRNYGVSGNPRTAGVWFNTNGEITAVVSGNHNNQLKLGDYNMGTWYQVTLECDLDNKIYDVYIDGILAGTDIAMNPTVSSREFNLIAGNLNNSEIYFDNVSLTTEPVDSHTITFEENGGDTESVPTEMTILGSAGTVGSLPEEPTKTDHTFGGWWTGNGIPDDSLGVDDGDGWGSQFLADTNVTSDMTVFAKWIVNNYEFNLSEGNIEITDGTNAGTYKVIYGNPQKEMNNISPIQVITLTGTTETNTLTVAAAAGTVKIKLNGINTTRGMSLTSSVTRNVELILADSATNIIQNSSLSNASPDTGGGLTITCENADELGHMCDDHCGTLEVYASTSYNGAAISGHNISIRGGNIYTLGGNSSPGIGKYGGTAKNLVISGGIIHAQGRGSYPTAGIGGGDISNADGITITGGFIHAIGYSSGGGLGGGGIFYGSGGQAHNITISGGTIVTAGGYGIGGPGFCSNIQINGGSVNASSISIQPVNTTAINVYKTIIALEGITAVTPVTNIELSGADYYNTHGIFTDALGKIYLYLPEGASTTSIAAGGNTYTGSVVTTSDNQANQTFVLVDIIAPILTAGEVTRISDTEATVKFTSDESGDYYFEIVEDDVDEPIIDTSGSGLTCGTSEQTISLDTLTTGAKDIYIVVKDEAGNVSEQLKLAIAAYIPPAHGTIQFEAGYYGTYEGYNGWIRVERIGGDDGIVSVDYFTTDDTAVAGIHYTSANGTLTWNDGDSDVKVIPCTIANDNQYNGYLYLTYSLANPTGAVIGLQNPLAVQISDNDTPPAPTGLKATAGNGKVTLEWDEVNSSYYKLYYSTTSGNFSEDSSIGVYDGTSHTIIGLTNGTTYYFTVKAGHNIYYSELADIISATPTVPSPGVGNSSISPAIRIITEESSNSTTNKTEVSAFTFSGIATVNVSTSVVNALLDKATNTGGTGKGDIIEVAVHTQNNINKLKVSLLQSDLAKIASVTDSSFAIRSPLISITFDYKALETINAAVSGGAITIAADVVDKNALSEDDKAMVEDRPVYDLTVKNGDSQVSDFGGGYATVAIPYTLRPDENSNAVVVYYLGDDGTLSTVRGLYDSLKKAVVFKTKHFSKFVIGYNAFTFTDVPTDAWYKNAVGFIAARGITSGTGNNQFSPQGKLTRAQFVVLLMNAYRINTQNQGETGQIRNFADAGSTYYTDYLLAAKGLSIVSGVGNNLFAPEKEITRQEMLVMLHNALRIIDEVPAATHDSELSSFNDAAQVANWAKEAVSTLVKAGIVGGSNNRLNPAESTTRAEIAQVLYNLLSK